MDGFLDVGHVFQIVHLDVDLLVVLIVRGDARHLVVDAFQHFQVRHAHDKAAVGKVALGVVLLQNADDLQLPRLALLARPLAVGEGQRHFILVDVHKRGQRVALGVGHALPAVAFGAVLAFAGILKAVARIGTHQDGNFGGLAVAAALGQPFAALQGKAHRLQRRRVDAHHIVQLGLVAAVFARVDGAV